MKTCFRFLCWTAILTTPLLAGCHQSSSGEVVSEGVIRSVSYMGADGHTIGLTRVNNSKAVPGGNGSWNEDMYGRLTHDFLFLTRPQHQDLGEQVIPITRLVEVQFGNGGIDHVDETHPAP
jgi:hypothetical protein